jgi:hypothetical protein
MPIELDDALAAALNYGQQRGGAADGARQVADALRGGSFDLLRGDNHKIAVFKIAAETVSPDGDITFTFAASTTKAVAAGRVTAAQFRVGSVTVDRGDGT